MQRWTSTFLVLFFVGAATSVVGCKARKHDAAATAASSADAAGSAAVATETAPAASADSAADSDPSANGDDAELAQGSDFSHLPDGGPVPPLPNSAPKVVNFGVILVAYTGAQFAPKTAPSRELALKRAKDLIAPAKANFEEAAKRGDHGSNANVGEIQRGVLEPAVEYALFSLGAGVVSEEPVDTPRGFWILKRNK